MATTVQAPRVELINTLDGLMAEISDLPLVVGKPWEVHARLYEAAEQALHEQYPELLIKQASVEDTYVIFWVEHR